MFYVATILLFDKNNKLLIYLRDDKPSIPFPNHWDLFGGIMEAGETSEDALERELQEELGIELSDYNRFGEYDCTKGDVEENKKYVFYGRVNSTPEEMRLNEGQRMTSIALEERHQYKFANILESIIDDFANSEKGKTFINTK